MAYAVHTKGGGRLDQSLQLLLRLEEEQRRVAVV